MSKNLMFKALSKNLIFKASFLVYMILLSPSIKAEIISALTMAEVKTKFEEVLKSTPKDQILGLFDIDMVLTQPSNPAMQVPNMKKNRDALKSMLADLSPLQKDIVFNLSTQSSPSILIEQDTPKVIQELMEQKIKVIALTASLTGPLGDIKSIESSRYNTLKTLGIDFANSFPNLSTLTFSNIPTYYGNHSIFYKGILFSNGEGNKNNKGTTLIEFLKKISFAPRTIIFVDDKEENIKQLDNAVLQLSKSQFANKINFIGILYKGAENYPSKIIDSKEFAKDWSILVKKAHNLSKT